TQLHCVLCGVSFSIARLRTRHEPRSHAWNYEGTDFVDDNVQPGDKCGEGCCFVKRGKAPDEFLPSEADRSGIVYSYLKAELFLEHVAGPGCRNTNAYNGHTVSASAVQCVRTAQCLLRKPIGGDIDFEGYITPAWTPEPDDEAWEGTSAWTLSGLNALIVEPMMGPSKDWAPIRHGVKQVNDAGFWQPGIDNIGMAFHPWCMEVYQRAVFHQKGKVDVDGVGEWWERDEVEKVERSVAVWECDQQWWDHGRGSEFLITDPLKDAGLVKMLQDATETSEHFDPAGSAFPSRTLPETTADQQQKTILDPFSTLPAELLQNILTELPNASIAAVREASRAFTHIPISFFYPLVRRDYPWIWEADQETLAALPQYSQWTKAVIDKAARKLNESGDIDHITPISLPRFETNWFKLYASLRKHSGSLPGLRNRERIWRDCQQIITMIDEMRARSA
ncbi:uncharacterized protein MYCGRDRAFT_40891, partial [Zymoseptoria tritici IPO323]